VGFLQSISVEAQARQVPNCRENSFESSRARLQTVSLEKPFTSLKIKKRGKKSGYYLGIGQHSRDHLGAHERKSRRQMPELEVLNDLWFGEKGHDRNQREKSQKTNLASSRSIPSANCQGKKRLGEEK